MESFTFGRPGCGLLTLPLLDSAGSQQSGEAPFSLGIVRFFKSTAKPAVEIRAVAPTPAPVSASPPRIIDAGPDPVEQVIKQLEDDVLLTMRVITHAADDVQSRVSETIDLVDHIRSASVELSNLSGTAFEVTTGLADTTR